MANSPWLGPMFKSKLSNPIAFPAACTHWLGSAAVPRDLNGIAVNLCLILG